MQTINNQFRFRDTILDGKVLFCNSPHTNIKLFFFKIFYTIESIYIFKYYLFNTYYTSPVMRKQPEPNVFLPPDTIFLSALAAGEK